MTGVKRAPRVVQRLLRHWRPHTEVRADWRWLAQDAQWQAARDAAARSAGPVVLLATGTGSNWTCSSFESLLAVALTLRGARVRPLLCDAQLPACQECDHQWIAPSDLARSGPQPRLCGTCFPPARDMLAPLGLPLLRYGQYAGGRGAVAADPALEEHARAGALRYYGRGVLDADATSAAILARYREAAAVTAGIFDALAQRERPDVAVFHHGIYVPQGVAGDRLRRAGVRVVNWGPAYRKGTVLFSHGESYHHTMQVEPVAEWQGRPWSPAHEQRITEYLRSRRTGANDWISFQPAEAATRQGLLGGLGLDPTKPVVGLLTNVIWDAQLHFRQTAFPSMLDWLFASIEHFAARPELQLVVRVHPAELLGTVPSRQRAKDEILRRFGTLPPNVHVVGPDEAVSTYDLMALCNAALVYGTKTALELACQGIPVIVAGDAWSRGKGFTIDVSTPQEFESALRRLPLAARLPPGQQQAALRYAYHFFFRRMLPIRALAPAKRFGPYRIDVGSLDDLRPGADPGLDLVCDGILKGRPFVFEP